MCFVRKYNKIHLFTSIELKFTIGRCFLFYFYSCFIKVILYACMYVCMYVCICIIVYVYVCMTFCMCLCMHLCIYTCMHGFLYICMHVQVCACMYVCLYAYVICICIEALNIALLRLLQKQKCFWRMLHTRRSKCR